jgi:hypothetical protein
MAIGMIVFSLGTLVFTLPQFLFDRYTIPSDDYDKRLCHAPKLFPLLSHHMSPLHGDANEKFEHHIPIRKLPSFPWAFACLIIGHSLHGAGSGPLHTLSMLYIDENVAQKKFATHLSEIHLCCNL